MALSNLRRTMMTVEHDQTQKALTQNRDLLALRKHLNQKKWWEEEIARLQRVLQDPTKENEHGRTRRLFSIAKRALAVHIELVELDLELLGLRESKEELEKQLAVSGLMAGRLLPWRLIEPAFACAMNVAAPM